MSGYILMLTYTGLCFGVLCVISGMIESMGTTRLTVPIIRAKVVNIASAHPIIQSQSNLQKFYERLSTKCEVIE